MIDEADLVRAIVERPDEGTYRLQYADWLEENSPHEVPCPHCGGGRGGRWVFAIDEDGRCLTCGRRGADGSGLVSVDDRKHRADFIRLQVEHARLTPRPVLGLRDTEILKIEPVGGQREIFRPDGVAGNHFATIRFCSDRAPELRAVYDLNIRASGGFGFGPTFSVGGAAGFYPKAVCGATCLGVENRLHLGDPSASLPYEARFFVSGEKCPVRAERDALEGRFRVILRNHREAVLPTEYGRPILVEDVAALGSALLPWAVLRRGFVRRWVGTWAQFKEVHEALVWGPAFGTDCPATAHPIEEVRLTDRCPGTRMGDKFFGLMADRACVIQVSGEEDDWKLRLMLLAQRWPGIRFTLP